MSRQPHRTLADGRADRSLPELLQLARRDLDAIEEQVRWLRSIADGQVRSDRAGGSSNVAPDATMIAHAAGGQARNRLGRAHAQLAWLVDKKLPSIVDALALQHDDPRLDERPRSVDEQGPYGPVTADGGYSAHRGDQHVPASRPDLREALEAQQRRLARGEGHG